MNANLKTDFSVLNCDALREKKLQLNEISRYAMNLGKPYGPAHEEVFKGFGSAAFLFSVFSALLLFASSARHPDLYRFILWGIVSITLVAIAAYVCLSRTSKKQITWIQALHESIATYEPVGPDAWGDWKNLHVEADFISLDSLHLAIETEKEAIALALGRFPSARQLRTFKQPYFQR